MLRDSFSNQVFFTSVLFSIFCLAQNQAIVPRIVNGFNVTSMNGFKHQVSIREVLYENNKFGNGHRCGGSLINNRTVLTAAHCIHDGKKYMSANLFVLTMGGLDRWTKDNNTLIIKVKKVVGHKDYNPDTYANDIAVIILDSDVPANHPTAAPIALASSSPIPGRACQISGWGTTSFKGVQPNRLMAGNLTINSKTECNQPNRHNGNVLNGMFCAGSFSGLNIVDSCQGDSGGPLTCDGILQGITSNGFECARLNYPGIYMDVYHYRSWISANNSSKEVGKIIIIFSSVFLSIFYKKNY